VGAADAGCRRVAAYCPAVSGADLACRIARHIRAAGPLSLAAFMAMALHDPQAGYYARRSPIGGAGDFVTAPEISQIFGELIGLWCAALWHEMGRPERVVLAELGPGRGTLTSDLLRAAATVPAFRKALHLVLVEASPVLRQVQQQRLGAARPRWVERFEDLPPGALLLVANEFFDALPIRQFVRGRAGWAERLVGLDAAGDFVFVAGREGPAPALLVPERLRAAADIGAVVEICPSGLALAGALGRRLAREPGAALIIDYGCFPSAPGPTLRAVRQHRPAPILAEPGTADLSAHVDFAALAEAARAAGAACWGPVPQGRFLMALGAEARLAALVAQAAPGQRRDLESGVRRLLDPQEMGTLFKALALASPGLPAPPGFAEEGSRR
jgi:NADH dehydrogenase [ubiquinone] 1 alpha subcomplex assembly factor 7